MKTEPSVLDGAEHDEELAQRDMQERGRRLAAFKAATEGKSWWYGKNGEAYLISDQCVAAGIAPRRIARTANPEKMLARLLNRRGKHSRNATVTA